MPKPPILVRLLVTGLVVALAVVVGWQLWDYYMRAPWTRDGRVRADVVQVAPDVSGLVTAVAVEPLQGHVQGVARGIVDREQSESPSLLANVNPTFSWVRLAQRIPVRVALAPVPDARD